MANLAVAARVLICGRIARASRFDEPDIGDRFLADLIIKRAIVTGFLVLDWWHRRDEALARLASWRREGRLRYREDVIDGIERVPEAFLRLLAGKNFGKQLVRVG